MAVTSSNTFFIAAVWPSSLHQKNAKRYLSSAAARDIVSSPCPAPSNIKGDDAVLTVFLSAGPALAFCRAAISCSLLVAPWYSAITGPGGARNVVTAVVVCVSIFRSPKKDASAGSRGSRTTISAALAYRSSALKSCTPWRASRLDVVASFWTHKNTNLPSCNAFMHFSVPGLLNAFNSSCSSHFVGKPPMTAPFGAMANTNGIGARSRSYFLTIPPSVGSLTHTDTVIARSATFAVASSNTLFIAAV